MTRGRRQRPTREEHIRFAYEHLALSTDPTLVGITLILPTGDTMYLSAADARQLYATKPAGREQGDA